MTNKKIAVLVLVLVLVGLVLALAIGIISAPDGSEGSVMMPAVKNASVSPPEGRYTDSFNYTVDVRFYEEALIEFQLYDPTKEDWITYKTLEYRDSRSWQPFEWDWIPSDRAWEGQNVTYRFRWNNTDLGYGKGPYIKEEIAWEFRNAIVRPSSGCYNDKFSYSVSVKLNKEEEISLEVFNIASYNWEVRGEKQYNDTGNWQELKWDNIANIASADSEGLASYRFFFIESGERHESEIYYGPTLKPKEIFKNATVDPYSGHYNTPFSYGVEVSTNEDVLLTVYDISIDEWVEKGKGTKTGNRWEWENIQFNKDCAGLASYKFVAGTHESEMYYGPTLKPKEIFKNATVDPPSGSYNKPFSYGVEIRTSEDVVLMVYDISIDEWVEKGKGTKTGDRGVWKNITFNKDCAGLASYKFVAGTHESEIFYGPALKHILPEEIFKNATVDPPSGSYNKPFSYGVEIRTSEDVVLMVYDISIDEWVEKGKGTKTGDRGVWKNITFNKDCAGLASYKFVTSTHVSKIFHGPTLKHILPEEIFKNATVDPPSGPYNKLFSYGVEVYISEDVVLMVYDISIAEWKEKGKGTKTGNRWEWENIQFNKDCAGLASYKFVAGTHVSRIYAGPTLMKIPTAEELFKNATLYPSRGNFSTAFNYTVEVNSSIEINNVTLEVYNGSWRHKGPGTSRPGGNKWEWKDITFGEGYEGVAKYKFLCNNKYKSAIYDGPLLLNETPTKVIISGGGGGGGGGSYSKPYMLYENANVKPESVLIGVQESKTFYYSVEVDKDDPVVLAVYNVSKLVWSGTGLKTKLKDTWKHEWNVTLTLDKNWVGYCKYRFYPKEKEKYASQVYYGPEIKMSSLSEWKQEIGFSDRVLAEPEIEADVRPGDAMWFKEFTYTANITHLDRANMTVALFVYKPGSNDWKPVPWRGYTYNPIVKSTNYNDLNTATISWTVEESEIFDYKDGGEEPGKESMFYIWYWDGCNEYEEITGGYFHGPRLLANHEPEFIEALPVSPGNGSTHAVYEYTFEVNDPDNETVHGYLTVIDPLGNERKFKEDPGKEGYIQFTIDSDQRVFTEEKLRVYTNITGKETFTSSYKLEFWDDGMIVNRTEAKIVPPGEGWFRGPHVSLVNVIPVVTELNPKQGKYDAEYEFIVGIKSTKENTLLLTLNIFDPSNLEHSHQTFTTRNISVATDTIGYATWRVEPTVFGPDDFGKTARYEIAWKDQYGNKGIINGTGPYIERAVPLLSWDLPLVPIISMVIVPFVVIVASLLFVLYDILGRLKGWKKQKEAKKKEKEQ